MPKARTRLTLKKKAKKGTIALGHEKNAPDAAQWEQLPRYQIFQVSDEDGESYDFALDNFARILPNGREVGDPDLQNHDYWVCKILDIRARNEHDVWALVEWFYSASDAMRINKSFDASHCGKYERLQSNHRDCISSNCFDGLARVKSSLTRRASIRGKSAAMNSTTDTPLIRQTTRSHRRQLRHAYAAAFTTHPNHLSNQ
ncbi:BAH domain-containing protein [Mycena sanguinolenta]|uniref:BAH domain-containing protein n=1 Tax=Mycena sanguinolenta TaxID=230812 RepID=A0A8H6YW81_9AGAR|nr:BAH domain-containing protein [Mycena sanguinolenta]